MADDGALSEGLSERLASVPQRAATVEELASIWRQLARGQLECVRPFFANARSHLLLRVPNREPPRGGEIGLVTLERVLLGENRKVLADALGVTASTLACRLKLELLQIGLQCAPGKVPHIVAILVHAAHGALRLGTLSLQEFVFEGAPHLLLSAEFDSSQIQALSPAVRDVVRLRVAGRSYANIAAERKTSYRTVANQLAAVGHRLGVSSRFDLMHFFLSSAQAQAKQPQARIGKSTDDARARK